MRCEKELQTLAAPFIYVICVLQPVTLRIGHMAGSLSLRLRLKTVACGIFGFSPSLQSKLPYVPILAL